MLHGYIFYSMISYLGTIIYIKFQDQIQRLSKFFFGFGRHIKNILSIQQQSWLHSKKKHYKIYLIIIQCVWTFVMHHISSLKSKFSHTWHNISRLMVVNAVVTLWSTYCESRGTMDTNTWSLMEIIVLHFIEFEVWIYNRYLNFHD